MGGTRVASAAVALLTAMLAAGTGTAGSASRPHISVYFVQGEQLTPVTRPGATARDAVRQLIAGPTRAEFDRGFRTFVPAGTRVRSVTVADGLATVDLTQPFATGTNPDSMFARLSELVHTLTGVQGTTKVQLLVNGATTAGMFPGVSTSSPITLRFLETPNVPLPAPPREKLPPPDPAVKTTQQHLIELGYLLRGDDDGRFGSATQNAIVAFQKWERLARTGLLDSRTKSRLANATHPSPLTHRVAGKRAEILLDRQVALLINNETSSARSPSRAESHQRRHHPATTASTPRSPAGGQCRFANGSHTLCRSSAASRSTSSERYPHTPPPTAASASLRPLPHGHTPSPTSGCRSR